MNDILFGNNNRPIIEKLSKRYFKASKSRNIITIIAIILTTVLFTTIFTLGSGMIDTVKDQNIRKMGGDGQAEYYGAAEPPVRCGESHLSGLTEPPIDSYSA